MKWLVATLMVAFAGPLAAQPTADAVVVREGLEPVSGVVIGQHVTLHVDVLFRDEMPRPPRVSLPDVPGLQIIRFETQGTTMQESIGGEAYNGQRFEFALYPRRGGSFDIPPASVTLLDREGNSSGSVQGQDERLDATVPAGVDASQPVIATSRLTLDEQWAPAPTGRFKAGDAVVRTITRSAEDVPGLAMLDFHVAAPEGVRVYADPPDIEDHTNRGIVTGQRADRITYVFERDGVFTLPRLAQPWWDLATHSLKTVEAAAIAIKVEAATTPASSGTADYWTAKSLALPLGLLAVLIVPALGIYHWHARRKARGSNSEREAFAAVKRACTGTNVGAIYQALSRWRAYLPSAQGDAAQKASIALRAALFAADPRVWTEADSARLFHRVKAIRQAPPRVAASGPLPPLNPARPDNSWKRRDGAVIG